MALKYVSLLEKLSPVLNADIVNIDIEIITNVANIKMHVANVN